jgi:hypothetical protein
VLLHTSPHPSGASTGVKLISTVSSGAALIHLLLFAHVDAIRSKTNASAINTATGTAVTPADISPPDWQGGIQGRLLYHAVTGCRGRSR